MHQGQSEKLREQQVLNIDDLLKIVTESVDAYKVCKERIDAFEKAPEKALGDADAIAKDAPRSPQTEVAPPPDMEDEGDIQF